MKLPMMVEKTPERPTDDRDEAGIDKINDNSDENPALEGPDVRARSHGSTMRLLSSTLGGVGAASVLSSAMAGEGKGEASGGRTGPKDSSTWAQGHLQTSVSRSSASNASVQGEAFRSRSGEDAVLQAQAQQEFDYFQGAREDLWMNEQENNYLNKDKGKQREEYSSSNDVGVGGDVGVYERAWAQKNEQGLTAQTRQLSQDDGAEVVALLSDPSFQPGLSFDEAMSSTDVNMDKQDNPFELSPAEIAFIEKLKATLPPPAAHKAPEPANPLNLLPDLHSNPATSNSSSHSDIQATTPIHAEESYLYHPNLATTAAVQMRIGIEPIRGLEDWFEVINSYHEDVWGYLKPYAQAAKAEVEKAEQEHQPNPTGGPAVRRLGMLLAHLDERFNERVSRRR
jgi:hypothetical protein